VEPTDLNPPVQVGADRDPEQHPRAPFGNLLKPVPDRFATGGQLKQKPFALDALLHHWPASSFTAAPAVDMGVPCQPGPVCQSRWDSS